MTIYSREFWFHVILMYLGRLLGLSHAFFLFSKPVGTYDNRFAFLSPVPRVHFHSHFFPVAPPCA